MNKIKISFLVIIGMIISTNVSAQLNYNKNVKGELIGLPLSFNMR